MMRQATAMAAAAVGMALVLSACTSAEVAKRQALDKGNADVAAGRIGEAIVEYRNAIRRDPRFGEAHWKLAAAYEKQGNAAATLREYVRAADLLPTNVDVQLKAAGYLLIAGQFDDAKARAQQALKLNPRNVDALIVHADAMASMKDIDGAVRDIEDALKTDLHEGRVYSALGALRLAQNQRAEAEAAFKQAVVISPKSVQARLALANFYWATGQAADVEKTLDDARAIDPADRMVNRMLAAYYMATQRLADAEAPLKVLAADKSDTRARLALADYYMRSGRSKEAIPDLKALAAAKGTYGEATLRLAQIERTAGHTSAAMKMLDDVIAKEPRNIDAMSLKSSWQLHDHDYDGAVASARAAVKTDARSAEAQYALGLALAGTKDTTGAIAAMTEVLRLNPEIVSAKLLLSQMTLASGDVNGAVQFATAARRAAPANPEVQLTFARSLLAKHDIVQAEPLVRQLVSRYPNNPRTLTLEGLLLVDKNDVAGARTAFSRAVDRDPESAEALEGLLAIDRQAGAIAAAVSRIELLLAAHPRSVPILLVAAKTYAAAKQPDRAGQALRNVIALQPGNATAYVMLGRTYEAQGRLDEALAQFDSAARRDTSQVGAATMAAMILQLQNKAADAQKRYEAIVTAHPTATVAANNLAWMYAEQGTNLDVALQLAQAALAQSPASPEISDTLGWVYYKKGLADLAIPPLEESVAKDPRNAAYRLHLGLAYAKAGKDAKARESLEMALRQNPRVEGADLAKQAIASLKS